MARYRRIAAQVPAQADVTVEPASETTTDQPQLTDSDVAPEASPAKTRKPRARRKSKAKAKS